MTRLFAPGSEAVKKLLQRNKLTPKDIAKAVIYAPDARRHAAIGKMLGFDPATQVQANQWYFANIGGQWYGGSGENMRPNQICKQGQMSEAIGPDGTWGGPMDSWAPRAGELVGYMMTTPARFWPSMKTVDERSNMVVQPWVDSRYSTASIKK